MSDNDVIRRQIPAGAAFRKQAAVFRNQVPFSTDPGRLEREADRLEAVADLSESIEWARDQAAIWLNRPASAEPARSYMAARYTVLANAAARSIELAGAVAEMRHAADYAEGRIGRT